PQPAGADLDALREDTEVGLVGRRLVANGQDDDVGTDGERAELALVTAVGKLRYGSDGSHGSAPFFDLAEAHLPPDVRISSRARRLRHPQGRSFSGGAGAAGLPLRRRLRHLAHLYWRAWACRAKEAGRGR